MSEIDFVIPWVDGNDPAWRRAFAEQRHADAADKDASAARHAAGEDASEIRYRDWRTLRYWFRSIERFAPWVRRIHFITWGHLPEWLATDHPQLHVVEHADYLPEAYCPTFNSNALELNIHRIAGLSEQFVLFNDDTFLGRPARPTDFFRDRLPRDMASLSLPALEPIAHIILNNLMLINGCYRPHTVISRNPVKWLSPRYGGGNVLKTLLLLPWSNFPGIRDHHMPQAFSKKSFEMAWERWGEALDATCRNRFRTTNDVSQWLIRYDALCRGAFRPIGFGDCRQMTLTDNNKAICRAIETQRYRMFCLHDAERITDFEAASAQLCAAFERLLPEKSAFEK